MDYLGLLLSMVLHIRSLGVCAPQGPTIYWATIAMGTALSLIWLILGELLRLQFNTLLGVFSILVNTRACLLRTRLCGAGNKFVTLMCFCERDFCYRSLHHYHSWGVLCSSVQKQLAPTTGNLPYLSPDGVGYFCTGSRALFLW